MTIPTDDEMEEFQDSLEALGLDEVERKLNQGRMGFLLTGKVKKQIDL